MDSVKYFDLDDESIHIDHKDIFFGLQTKTKLKVRLDEGDISDCQYKNMYETLQYIQKKFLLDDEIINNAVWTDVENRAKATWSQVQSFLDEYNHAESIRSVNPNELYDEFCDYQPLCHDGIPEEASHESKFSDGKGSDENEVFHYKMDVLCWHLSNLLVAGTNL